MGPELLESPQELPGHILRKSTIKRFGHDPVFFRSGSMKMVRCRCVVCKKKRTKAFRYAIKQKTCLKCSNGINARKSAKKNSIRMKAFYANGGRHPMLGREQSQKAKDAMKKYRDFAKGKNHGAYGKRKKGTIEYKKSDGDVIFLRSLYELAYAEYLDKKGYMWDYEPFAFPIVFKMNGKKKEGTYCPDFYIANKDVYIEVKGWWRWDAKPKFDAFKKQYPKLKVVLVSEKTLKKKGLKYLPRHRE